MTGVIEDGLSSRFLSQPQSQLAGEEGWGLAGPFVHTPTPTLGSIGTNPTGEKKEQGLRVQVGSEEGSREGSLEREYGLLPSSATEKGHPQQARLSEKSTLLSPFVPANLSGQARKSGTGAEAEISAVQTPERWTGGFNQELNGTPEGTPSGVAGYAMGAFRQGGLEHEHQQPHHHHQEFPAGMMNPSGGPGLPPAMTYQPFQFRPPPDDLQRETFQPPQPFPPHGYAGETVTPGQGGMIDPREYHSIPGPADPHQAQQHTGGRILGTLDQGFQYPQAGQVGYAHTSMQQPQVHAQPGQQQQHHLTTQPSYHYGQHPHLMTNQAYPAQHVQQQMISPGQMGVVMNGYGGHPQAPPGVVFARSTDLRATRPKVKLTYEDKRRIVEIARSNTNLRQEDIAQQYGVDRSTISKILIQAHRWTGPPQPAVVPIPKPAKQAGGRFPAIENEMLKWWDSQEAAGREVKDSTARDRAKDIARAMGLGEDRFKASAKWLDKFKERRKRPSRPSGSEDGQTSYPPSVMSTPSAGYPTVYTQQPMYMHPGMQSGYNSPNQEGLSRSQSSTTLASTDSGVVGMSVSGSQLLERPYFGGRSEPDSATMHGSISDISNISAGLHSRQRSRSSPNRLGPYDAGSLDPASGRVPRTMTSGLQRSQSTRVGGPSPSPRRPNTFHRTQSSTSSVSSRRAARPPSLAASAFGLTPLQAEDASMGPSVSHTPDRKISDGSVGSNLQPFMNSMSGMNISPETMSSAGTLSTSSSTTSIQHQHGMTAPSPLTPISSTGQFVEYRTAEPAYHHQQQQHQPQHHQQAYQNYTPSHVTDAHRLTAYAYQTPTGYQQTNGHVYETKTEQAWRNGG